MVCVLIQSSGVDLEFSGSGICGQGKLWLGGPIGAPEDEKIVGLLTLLKVNHMLKKMAITDLSLCSLWMEHFLRKLEPEEEISRSRAL